MNCGGGERMFGEQGLDPTGAKILFEHPDGCEADAQTLTHRGHDRLVIVETIAALDSDVPTNEWPEALRWQSLASLDSIMGSAVLSETQ